MSRRPPAPVAARLSAATRALPAPLAVARPRRVRRQRRTLVGRSHGLPIRIATKSLRSRPLIERALGRDGFAGLMCYAVPEALWWARTGHTDLMVAYPSVDVPALTELAADPALTAAVAVMVDSIEHVDFIARHVEGHEGLRVAVDVDASLRIGPAHLGVRRSPTRTPRAGRGRHPPSAGAWPGRRGPDVLRRADRRAARLLARGEAGQGAIAPRAAHAPCRDRLCRKGPRRPRLRQRRRHRKPARHRPRPLAHRARSRLRSLRADPLRRLRRARARARRLLRHPGGAPTCGRASSRHTAAATSRRARPAGPACPRPSRSRGSSSCAPRGPARCRPRSRVPPPTPSRLGIGYGSATPRRASWPNGSPSSPSWRASEVVGRAATYRGEGQCFG